MTRELTASELAFLEELDSIGAPPAAPSPTPAVATKLHKLIVETKERHHDNAKRNGRTAKHNQAVDAHRKAEGRHDYNLSRRVEYAVEVQKTGRTVRPYGQPDDAAKRKKRREQIAASKARRKAAMTPGEIEAFKKAEAARKRAARLAVREARQV
jgi:hypothetical protein